MTNYLDSLITRISDPELAQEITAQVAALRDTKQFGLVYERHLPETVRLYDQPITLGTTVERRATSGDMGTVKSVGNGCATVTFDDAGEPVDEEVELSDLVAVREFGQPIYPGLKPLSRVERGGDKPFHTVINAENYHALETLLYAHEGRVDCIYIDPPYNTGDRNWKYNNDYVDGNDAYRHSKWLSFMERRLRLARRLLKADGVLIVTIDEHEVHRLGVLLQQVFPRAGRSRAEAPGRFLHYMVTIVINPKGTGQVNFGRVDEHALFVVPATGTDVIRPLSPPSDEPSEGLYTDDSDDDQDPEEAADGEPDPEDEPEAATPGHTTLHLRRRGAQSSYRRQRPNQFYAIKVNEDTNEVIGVGPLLANDDAYDPEQREGSVVWVYPIDQDGNERVWRYQRSTMQDYIANGEIRVGTRWEDRPQRYTLNHVKPLNGPQTQRVRTVWWRKTHDAGTHGTTLLSKMFGKPDVFPFPKSIYAVRDTLETVVGDRPDALIVDFFAGSGTTMHATALLNAQDDGRRAVVLVTNNAVDAATDDRLSEAGLLPGDPNYESEGIFLSITKPRIEAAVSGMSPNGEPYPQTRRFRYVGGGYWAAGLKENVEFFDLEYLNRDTVARGKAFEAIAPLLWMKAGATGQRVDVDNGSWSVPDGAVYGVLFNTNAWGPFAEAVRSRPDLRHVFVVTDSLAVFQQVVAELPPDLPSTMLYEDYLSNFEINTGGPR